jgi:hypothetical protein
MLPEYHRGFTAVLNRQVAVGFVAVAVGISSSSDDHTNSTSDRSELFSHLLEVEHLSHDCILAEDRFQHINNPVSVNGQPASA